MEITNAVARAVDNVIKEGTTDVELFSRPFEIDLIAREENRKEIIRQVTDSVSSAISGDNEKIIENLALKQISYVLVPKKRNNDFRKCALIDVLDEIKYLSVVLLLANKIESKRLPTDRNTVFSYRYNESESGGRLFDGNIGIAAFRHRNTLNAKQPKYTVMVECDISKFYDRIEIHKLERALLSAVSEDGAERKIVEIIRRILLFWSKGEPCGLPVGSNASRILAEAFLIDMDNYLLYNKIPFTRFVDDIRLFASSEEQARKFLYMLTDKLSQAGIFLNTEQTKTMDISMLTEDGSAPEKEIKTTEKTPEERRRINGYVGLVPTKFRELSTSEISKYREYNPSKLIDALNTSTATDECRKEIKTCIKSIVAQKQYSLIKAFPQILHKWPQFIPYFIDMVNKHKPYIADEIVESIKADFSKWFYKPQVPEYILVYIVRIFDSANAKDRKTLLGFFEQISGKSVSYIGRALLEALHRNLKRREILELKNCFKRADYWEQRQIFFTIVCRLLKFETNAFYRSIIRGNTDPLMEMIKNIKSAK